MWDDGYRVVQWNEIIVYHEFSSLNRNERRVHQRHARNEATSVAMRYPGPWVLRSWRSSSARGGATPRRAVAA